MIVPDVRLGLEVKAVPEPVRLREVPGRGWHALQDLVLPALVVHGGRLRANVEAMAAYCRQHGVLLAPHAKTHMSPGIAALQERAGCWGFTAATPVQLRLLRSWGVSRVLYANQPWDVRDVAGVTLLVDSVAAVDHLAGTGAEVLVEVGMPGARTGCRTLGAIRQVAAAAVARGLRVAGVECFEGLVGGGLAERLAQVDGLLERVDEALVALRRDGVLGGPPLVSAGGSAYFDRVVERFGGRDDLRVLLRSGCYVTQDGGFYDATSPLAGRAAGEPRLANALELWSTVLSRPEPGLAVAGFGKRDAGFDMGMPRPVRRVRGGKAAPLDGCEVVALSDQHAHVRVPEDADLRPGDRLAVHVSHPCTTLDKWRFVAVVDDDLRVVDGLVTCF